MAQSKQPGVLVIISGPSGVGKTTICHRLVGRMDAFLSVSMTTRPRRENEVDGRDYRFVSKDEFDRLLEQGAFLEYAQVYGGHCYGTPAAPVRENLASGRVVILEIDIAGAEQVVRVCPDAVGIFILAPTPSDQQSRLVGRREDSPEAIQERLSKADGEIRYAHESGAYQYFVVNRVVDETVGEIVRIVQEKQRA